MTSAEVTTIASKGLDRSSESGYETLGHIGFNMYRVAAAKFRDVPILDVINSEFVKASEYFHIKNDMLIVKPERLPADADIKGAYIKTRGPGRGRPKFEASQLDFDRINEVLLEDHIADDVELRGKTFYTPSDGGVLVRTRTQNMARKFGDPNGRKMITGITLSPGHYDSQEKIALSLSLLDTFYQNGTFVTDDEVASKLRSISERSGKDLISGTGQPPSLELRTELRLELRGLLRDEQKLTLLQEVSPRTIEFAKILSMPADQLRRRVSDVSADLDAVKTILDYDGRRRR